MLDDFRELRNQVEGLPTMATTKKLEEQFSYYTKAKDFDKFRNEVQSKLELVN